MNHLRLQVLLNGRELHAIGLEDTGHLAAKVEYLRLRRPKEPIMPMLWEDVPIGGDMERCDLELSGSTCFPSPSEILRWIREPLSPGDEVTIRVLRPGPTDEPKEQESDKPL